MARKVKVGLNDAIQEIRFPSAGINQSHGYDRQVNAQVDDGVFARTTPFGVNVQTYEPSTDRDRGGQRSGIEKFLQDQVSGTNAIQAIGEVSVTSGYLPGTGNTVDTMFGLLGNFSDGSGGLTNIRIGSFNSNSTLQQDTGADLTFNVASNIFGDESPTPELQVTASISARAILSGSPAVSYTSLGIADGTAVTVAMGVVSESSTAKYVLAANGKRIAAPAALPGTSVDYLTGSCFGSSSGHHVVALQRGAAVGKLTYAIIDDSGSITVSKVNFSDTGIRPGVDIGSVLGTYAARPRAVASGTLVVVDLGDDVVKFDLADGGNYAVVKTRAQIVAQAALSGGLWTRGYGVASTSGSIVAVAMKKDSVNYAGLVFIDATLSTFPVSALNTLTTDPVAVNFAVDVCSLVSDGTDFYVAVYAHKNRGPNTLYFSTVSKVNGTTGAVAWTTTLGTKGTVILCFASGIGTLQVNGSVSPGYSASLNTTTGSIIGSGVISGSHLIKASADAGSVTVTTSSAVSSSEAGPTNVLVAVSNGTLKVRADGGWQTVTSGLSSLSTTAARIGVAAAFSYLYFADGAHYKRYNPATNTMESWTASAGDLPLDGGGNRARLIALWNGRIVLSGLPKDSRNIFMTAQGDPTDFEYSRGTFSPVQAIALNDGRFGQIGDVVTALIPFRDDALIIGEASRVHVLRGDPYAGGRIDLLTDSTGIAFGDAWCMDPYGTIYFMSNLGSIYQMQAGQLPVRLSQSIDGSLRNIDLSKNTVCLQWDDKLQGVRVFVTSSGLAGPALHFLWELRSRSWWFVRFTNNDHSPRCVCTFNGNTPDDRVSLIGSFDGYVRSFSPSALDDDGTPIDSEVWFGPLTSRTFDSILWKELQGILGQYSGTVNWDIHVGSTAETAFNSDSVYSGTLSAGRSNTQPIRREAHALYAKITASNFWSMESLRVKSQETGERRRRDRGSW